ncbi:MAG: segregation ATPase FtsK/SpoIIIE, family [Chthoniobacter sp.]|jgi:S-DNA-T family DNA segregation ATPase FtsK/SpoIIIE|nr:segregation ATPase FtsK/SpoIIIE, family [Chthoniobacter sp.]
MAGRLITVSQLKCACLDEDWRRRWLRGEKPPTRSFAPAGGVPVQGTLFHQLAETFTDWLETEQGPALREPETLWVQLYDRFARVKLDELIAAGRLPSAHHLSQALRAFCGRLAELRARVPGFLTWHDVYFTREFRLDRVQVSAHELLISGRPDAIRLHPQDGIEVVDYKLSRGGNLKHDLLQIAIYTRLLRVVKPGLRFTGVLEFYEPALHVLPVSAAELEGLFEEVVQPVIAELATSGAAPLEAPTPATPPADPTAEAIERCFGEFKLRVKILSRHEAPQLIRYHVQPASGVKVISLANRAEDLQVALRLKQPPLIQPAPGCVTIDIPKETPDTVPWRDLTSRAGAEALPLEFPIGLGIDNTLLTANLGDANMCHALVAGTSGSGKSEFLKCVVASLLARHSPATLRLSIIDPKILTFGALKHCRHLSGPVITELADAIACLEAAVQDMDARYEQLAREGFENLVQRGPREDLPFHVIIFDEFGDLVLRGRREKERFETLVARLAQKGRAAGIHLVLTTQRPDSKIVTGLIKSNLPLKICLRVTSAVNSQVVLDQPGGETLLGRGDLLCDRGRGLERAQSPFISQEELRQLVERA